MVKVKITSKNGLHARPASVVVKEASQYDGDITITKGDKSANAKSIMKVMGLGIVQGDEITIEASGCCCDAGEIEEKLKTIIETSED